MTTLAEIQQAIQDSPYNLTFSSVKLTDSRGSPVQCRQNGKLKTWKREPGRWQLPVKHGLRQCFYITGDNGEAWKLNEIAST